MANGGSITLAIETSNPGPAETGESPGSGRPSVCLGKLNGSGSVEVIAREVVKSASRHDDDLMPAIDRLVAGAGLTPRDIGRVAVSIGPGGFTGLRVAVAATKMICEAMGAECIAVPTARALIRRVEMASRVDRETIILLAWKRDDAWAERYAAGRSIEPSAPGMLGRFDALKVQANSLVVCDAPVEVVLRERGCLPKGAAVVRPFFDAAAVLEASVTLTPIDALALEPLYPREPESVTKWRELKRPR